MNPQESFIHLPKNEQVYALFHYGRDLHERKYGKYLIKLIMVHDLFVEVWFNSREEYIDKIKVISRQELVKTYKKQINVDGLVSA